MKDIKIGDVYLVEYKDATYSYVDFIKNKVSIPKPVLSVGRVRRVTAEFIDICLSWTNTSQSDVEYDKGIIIPLTTIASVKKLTPQDE